jgi:Phage integrase SAM-like domain
VGRRLLNRHAEHAAADEQAKFRTTPITSTITSIAQLPHSAILYKCSASPYWQFRVFLEGAQRKRSTQTTDIVEAKRQAKLIYAEMLQTLHGSDSGKRKLSSTATLSVVAASLWEKQQMMIENGELNPQKNTNDKAVFNKHIRPFFAKYELTQINNDVLEQFKMELAKKKLAKATQKSYLDIVSKLLKEAVKKGYIHTQPIKPNVRIDDTPRGYFTPTEYTKLWQTAKRMVGKTVEKKKLSELNDPKAKPYRKTTITAECVELILFMRNTFIRPTDIKFIRHRDIHIVNKDGVELLELRHGTTKRHSRYMISTEHAITHYKAILADRKRDKAYTPDDYVFMPKAATREYALKELSRQFMAVLEEAKLKTDMEGKPRTLYSLRHTAIVTAVRDGISINTLAANARTSPDMIDRFYASHIRSALEMGTEIVDSVNAKRRKYGKMAKKSQ